ncbi:alpha/beta hydrolase [Bacillus sp. FJAT-28004]|uniref:alpha/beta hydrolase n=1 Tax=Bacillus sp. FJAT-28004 TaxID=1679165 RepID=UPI0013792B2A|nr:alpha/beta hydrolase [Bacillus sp. FJAT-28004]
MNHNRNKSNRRIEERFQAADGTSLLLRFYLPHEDVSATKERSVIVLFFGGGWTFGSPDQFHMQCEYFASRGMIAVAPEYRVKSRHGVTPFECVEDARAALRRIIELSETFGFSPDKIVVGGGSAGGHLAACSVIAAQAETNWTCPAAAMLLFNPALDTSTIGLGGRSLEISPIHRIRVGLPPTMIFHGTSDELVPIQSVFDFQRQMEGHGNLCTIIPYEHREHGFFNYREDGNDDFFDTLRHADHFLVSHGLLLPKVHE